MLRSLSAASRVAGTRAKANSVMAAGASRALRTSLFSTHAHDVLASPVLYEDPAPASELTVEKLHPGLTNYHNHVQFAALAKNDAELEWSISQLANHSIFSTVKYDDKTGRDSINGSYARRHKQLERLRRDADDKTNTFVAWTPHRPFWKTSDPTKLQNGDGATPEEIACAVHDYAAGLVVDFFVELVETRFKIDHLNVKYDGDLGHLVSLEGIREAVAKKLEDGELAGYAASKVVRIHSTGTPNGELQKIKGFWLGKTKGNYGFFVVEKFD